MPIDEKNDCEDSLPCVLGDSVESVEEDKHFIADDDDDDKLLDAPKYHRSAFS